jgi:hypothetical protein
VSNRLASIRNYHTFIAIDKSPRTVANNGKDSKVFSALTAQLLTLAWGTKSAQSFLLSTRAAQSFPAWLTDFKYSKSKPS